MLETTLALVVVQAITTNGDKIDSQPDHQLLPNGPLNSSYQQSLVYLSTMRQRITFVHEPGNGIDLSALQVTKDGLEGPNILAMREDRLTISLEELPTDLSQALRGSQGLHIRWVSPLAYGTVGPLSSRMSPGFHLFYRPRAGEDSLDVPRLCETLKTYFGLEGCSAPDAFTSFNNPSDGGSAKGDVLQYYYEPREDLFPLIKYISAHMCRNSDKGCQARSRSLHRAAAFDFSYDAASGAVKATAQWPHQTQPLSTTTTPGHKTEVGILAMDASAYAETHDLGISGVLAVLGDQTEPSPVMFSFPARHRQLDSSFSARFLHPTGLHPTLQLEISSHKPPMDEAANCALHAHLTLPKTIFADRYQLSDDLLLASKNLTALRYASSPVDLEAPVYATPTWGSSVLLEMASPRLDDSGAGIWTAEVPLHLRYLEPNPTGSADIEVPYPAVFWACSAGEGTELSNNPFDRVNLGYDALFDQHTVFWHVQPKPASAEMGERLMSPVKVPVLNTQDEFWVRTGTACAVLLGFGWVLAKLVAAYLGAGYGRQGKQATPSTKSAAGTKKRQ